MGGDREAFVRERDREYLLFPIDEKVVDLSALLTDEMFVPFHHRVKVLGASQGEYLEFFLNHQFLEITVDRPQADVWNDNPHLFKNLIRRGVGGFVFNRFPDHVELPGMSSLGLHLGFSYVLRSSARDFLVSPSIGALAW